MVDEAHKTVSASAQDMSREGLENRCVGILKTAGGSRPDLKLVETECGPAVLKDYRRSDPLFRAIVGPILIRRERGALLRLTGVQGVPRLIRAVDRHALLIEHVDGAPVRSVPQGSLPQQFFVQLEDLIRRMHQAGVAHCDLRTGGNIMIGGDGRPYIIDFASCVFRGRGLNPFIRWLFGQFQRGDLHAVLLLKKRASPDLLTPEDKAALARSLPFERPAVFIGKSVRNLTRRLLTRRR